MSDSPTSLSRLRAASCGAVPAGRRHGFYLLKVKPVFIGNLLDLMRGRWQGKEPPAPGKHKLSFKFNYDGLATPALIG